MRLLASLACCLLVACSLDSPPSQAPSSAKNVPQDTASPSPSALASQLTQYQTDARACSATINSAPLGHARACAQNLLALAAGMVPAYAARKPHCANYLDATLKIRHAWPSLDLETIERDFHHDGALPASETTADCYHMKDLIVHPATTLKLLSLDVPALDQAGREIEEVIAHAGVVRSGL